MRSDSNRDPEHGQMERDKAACAELVQDWGFARDQGRWDDLLAIFHPGGEIAVSWFRGPYAEFVARCRANFGRGSEAKHVLGPARVRLNGARATAETNVAILVRQTIDGVAVDLTSNSRFLDRIEPSAAFDALMARSDAAKYPAPYRYMAYRVYAAGRTMAEPVHHDGRPETEALKARYAAWLAGQQ
jgi:hypothetical protein